MMGPGILAVLASSALGNVWHSTRIRVGQSCGHLRQWGRGAGTGRRLVGENGFRFQVGQKAANTVR